MSGVQRSIKRTRMIRVAAVLAVALNVFLLAVDVALGSALAFVPALAIAALLVLVVMQTRLIRTGERARVRRIGELEVAWATARASAGSCAHPDAEPVDLLLTGERVGWVCPACNADLPAGWTPARHAGTLTAMGTAIMPGVAALSGTGCLPARAVEVYTPESASPVASYALARTDREIAEAHAAIHFEALARVGMEYCVSYCPMCAGRLAARVNWRVSLPPDDAGPRNWIDEERRG